MVFKYENRDSATFEGLNMVIREGEKVAIVGPSGNGKSTIFRLLLGFYFPQEGQIFIEGN